MWDKAKKVLGCVITLTLIVLGITRLNYLVRPVDTDKTYRRIHTFHDVPENSVEVIVYGSSHAFLGVNVMEMYDKYGIGAYNYGTNWEKINTVKLFMRDSFKTQKPKLAIIETYFAGTVLEDTDINAEIFYTSYLENDEARRNYLRQCFGTDPERWLSYYMPLCAFHDNWNNISKTSFMPLISSGNGDSTENIRNNMGFAPYKAITKVKLPDSKKIQQKKLSKAAVMELDDIVAMCKERDTDILFITVPYQKGYPYAAAMEKYAKENGCAYINLFDHIEETGIDGNADFKDSGHLNTSGATKVADYLGKYITANYDVTDMRLIQNNLWEQAGE